MATPRLSTHLAVRRALKELTKNIFLLLYIATTNFRRKLKMELKKVSDVEVTDFVRRKPKDQRPLKGGDIIPEEYANIALNGRKKSGKTLAVKKLIEKCATRETTVIAFVSTLEKDDTWEEIEYNCLCRGIPFVAFQGIKEDKKTNHLTNLVKHLQHKNETPDQPEEPEVKPTVSKLSKIQNLLQDPNLFKKCLPPSGPNIPKRPEAKEKKPRKPPKPKERAPEYMIVIDDLSDELKNPELTALLKKNRHFKSKVIISTQWPNDLPPESRKQIDTWLLWPGFGRDRLDFVLKSAGMPLDLDQFDLLYKYLTHKEHEKDFPFLYYDVNTVKFRRKFTYELPQPKNINFEKLKIIVDGYSKHVTKSIS